MNLWVGCMKEDTHAKHVDDTTAAALPPELPPADLCSRSRHGVDELDGWNGFTTAPWIVCMFRDLDDPLIEGNDRRKTGRTPCQIRHN